MLRRPIVTAVLLVLAAAGFVRVSAQDATPAATRGPRLTAILVSATNAPLRVPGSDGLEHLEYDLVVTNAFASPVTLTAVEVMHPTAPPAAPRRATPWWRRPSRSSARRRPPRSPRSATVAVVIDSRCRPTGARAAHPPDRLRSPPRRARGGPHRQPPSRRPRTGRRPPPAGGARPAPARPRLAHRQQLLRRVHAPPRRPQCRRRRPPRQARDLRHRLGPAPGGPALRGRRDAQRAVFRLRRGGRRAAAGTVVFVRDGLPEETPDQPTAVEQPADFGGNQVIVRIGPGVCASYAHLQPAASRWPSATRSGRAAPGEAGQQRELARPAPALRALDGPDPLRRTACRSCSTATPWRGRSLRTRTSPR